MSALCLVIFGCALVQSVFGVGLLVFGTPALLFLGYGFPEALFRLLPCSLLVSALQIGDAREQTKLLLRDYLACLAPAAAIGAALVFWSDRTPQVRAAVGAMMLVSALLRVSGTPGAGLAGALASNRRPALALIGLVHGLTNMGGGLLTAFVNAAFVEKSAARSAIALGYLIMASLQFVLILALRGPQAPLAELALLIGLTGCAYLLIGRRLFTRSPQRVYQHSMTALMALCGLLLLR